eukprot:Amastigsp_a510994_13.p1 type:complete len:724 gc:universal Amastigsp_a510994_13:125-2296(+)
MALEASVCLSVQPGASVAGVSESGRESADLKELADELSFTITADMEAEEADASAEAAAAERVRLDELRSQAFSKEVQRTKFQRLTLLIQKTELYAAFLVENMREALVAQSPESSPAKGARKRTASKSGAAASKRSKALDGAAADASNAAALPAQRATAVDVSLLTGGTLRDYQEAGVLWMISLYENGLNGILADEMGLGKTIQTIAFLTHLRARGVWGPFLIVAPLATLTNWGREVRKFAPSVPELLYHGTKDARAALRSERMRTMDPSFPIVVTSYEIAMRDSKFLRNIPWKYIIVDEGHRLKNMDCRLLRELKTYSSANKLLLTGTPLQNSLKELWALLNFLLPDIFDDAVAFEDWFGFAELEAEAGLERAVAAEEENTMVSKLHGILRPFLLRRLKTDVDLAIPKKTELLVYTALSPQQRTLYEATLARELRSVVADTASGSASASKSLKLQNLVVQLRKCCNHPYLFDYPLEPNGEFRIDDQLVEVSGKLQLLDKMLPRLAAGGHKVLIFSQMTKMIDVLQDYCWLRGYAACRFDGGVKHEDRELAIAKFNTDPDVFLFLLSTRAGGLGITLNAADTVIIFDSDWNPQIDLQAQDRCHRIGQTRPVAVFRLATALTVEGRILKRANEKRKLERMVIHKRQFKGLTNARAEFSAAELAELLHDGDAAASSCEVPLVDDATIALLCDRARVMAMPVGAAGPGFVVVDEAASGADLGAFAPE